MIGGRLSKVSIAIIEIGWRVEGAIQRSSDVIASSFTRVVKDLDMTCNTFGSTRFHEVDIANEQLLTLIELLNPILEHIQNGFVAFASSSSESAYASVIAALHRYNSLASNIHDTTDLINNLSSMC